MSNSKWAALGAALLASTSLTTAAKASEWTATVSGNAELGIAYVSTDETDYSDANVGLINDSEVRFDFKMVADNGITFGYHMEVESDATGAFDEYYAMISGAFGRVEIGQADGAYDVLLLTPPGCSYSCPGDDEGYLFDHFKNVSYVTINNEGLDSSDALKLTYFTPKFSGFTAGISYIPSDDDAEGTRNTNLNDDDETAWEFGARWQGDLTEDVDLGVSAAYAIGDDDTFAAGDGNWSIAAELGLFGGAIGARYTSINQDKTWQSDWEESSLSIGAEYGTGPWGFFVNYATTLDSEVGGNTTSADGDWGLSAEVDYDLAPGVKVGAIFEYGSPDESNADNEFAIGTFMGLTF